MARVMKVVLLLLAFLKVTLSSKAIETDPKNRILKGQDGDSLTMRCKITVNDPQPAFTWTKQGSDEIIHKGEVLNITRMVKKDEGQYTCTASNLERGHFEVIYYEEISLLQSPSSGKVEFRHGEGYRSLFCVAISGSPTPKITWTKQGDPSFKHTGPELSVNNTLTGHYTCTASNGYGTNKTREFQVDILGIRPWLPIMFVLITISLIGNIFTLFWIGKPWIKKMASKKHTEQLEDGNIVEVEMYNEITDCPHEGTVPYEYDTPVPPMQAPRPPMGSREGGINSSMEEHSQQTEEDIDVESGYVTAIEEIPEPGYLEANGYQVADLNIYDDTIPDIKGKETKPDILNHLPPTMKRDVMKLLIQADALVQISCIGKGHFGEVYLCNYSRGRRRKMVAVKTLKGVVFSNPSEVQKFLEEALKIKDFKNDRVLSPLGIVFHQKDPQIVQPYMENGDLKTFLQKRISSAGPYVLKTLLGFCRDVAEGMCYLSKQMFPHMDLAAKNCLVDCDSRVKVGDFGMTHDLYDKPYYKTSHSKPLPVRWMALESITENKYTCQSDVWSYGVVMWEVFTHGEKPYKHLDRTQFLTAITQGQFERLGKPDICPVEIYSMMIECWNDDPDSRPNFSEMKKQLKDFSGKLKRI